MNRLAHEPSPYLKQHADNPVDWYPWGPEALQRARAEDRPILLSVGYSACHWCHVMAHESFENSDTAALMNKHYVNIKLDREERPDLDQLYQGVVQLMGRGGGWPLTVFLTPDLRPFFGGTYFPPVEKHGLPSFPALLNTLAEAWQKQRPDIEEQAEHFKQGLTHYASYGLDATAQGLQPEDIGACARKLESRVDRRHGGFGRSGPKFPNPMNVALMLRGYRRTKQAELKSAALLTLEKMALGGVYDQLGGGFHRYSVDERWLVPHFEKMLYDNAQLVHLYAEAWQLEPRPLWKKTVEETVAYVRREMTSPQGGFYAAQDADSEGEEGKFFVWTSAELDALLGPDDARLLKEHFGVAPGGNFEHGASVLEVVNPMPEQQARIDAARATLLQARSARVPPGRDDKVLAGWNGLMIRGLAFASRVFQRPDWLELARGAADFVLAELRRDDGRLHRSWQGGPRLEGMLEDYGDLAAGLCALYQACFEPKYLQAAEALADEAVTLFWDHQRSAYRAAPHDTADLLVPTYALHDNAFPSGASSLTEAHVALAALTGRSRHLDQARHYLQHLRSEMTDNPMGFGHLLLAADAYLDGAPDVVLVGSSTGTAALLAPLNARYAPTLCVVRHDAKDEAPNVLREQLTGKTGAQLAAFVCRSFTCAAPVSDAESLQALLGDLLG